MVTKCEKAVHDIFPVARAVIAKKLVDVYKFSQMKASKRMGISQPAISQYKKNIRGKKQFDFIKSASFISVTSDIAKGIAEGSIKTDEVEEIMCRICREVQD